MGFADERTAIESAFATGWAAGAYSVTPVAYENVSFVVPNPPRAFVRLTIRRGQGQRTSAGSAHRTTLPGVIQVDVLTPENTGTATALAMADAVAAIFTDAELSSGGSGNIIIGEPYVSSDLGGGAAGYLQQAVTIPYQRDALV